MRGFASIGVLALVAISLAGSLAGPALAQQASSDATAPAAGQQAATPAPGATQAQPAAPAVVTETPAVPAPQPNQPTVTSVAPATSGQPNLTVATVKLTDGRRASKLIGSGVYNDQDQQIGSIDDLIVMPDNRISLAIISVGGFLGIGSKLVAVPYDQLRLHTTNDHEKRLELAGASKESLHAMPNFTYGG